MDASVFGRVSVALVTPFQNDPSGQSLEQPIDQDAFLKCIDHVSNGLIAVAKESVDADSHHLVGGIIICGSTGEQHSLSVDEKCFLYSLAVAHQKHQEATGSVSCPIIAGVAAVTTKDAVKLAQTAVHCGCRGIMLGLPPYLKLNDQEIIGYVMQVKAVMPPTMPLLLYNNVVRNGYGLSVAGMSQLHKSGTIWGVKYAAAGEALLKDSKELQLICPDVRLYTGGDVLAGQVLKASASTDDHSIPHFYGLTSIIGNVYPVETARTVKGLLCSRQEAVTFHNASLVPLCNAVLHAGQGVTLPVGVKCAMRMLGVIDSSAAHCRLPIQSLQSGGEVERRIEEAIAKFSNEAAAFK